MDAFDDAFGSEGGAGGVPPPEVEVDPAAEFLAKEQEDLGGLGEDLGFTAAPAQEVDPVQNGVETDDLLFGGGAGVSTFTEEPQQPDNGLLVDSEPLNDQLLQKDVGVEDVDALANHFQEDSAPAPAPVENLSQGFSTMRVREEPESIKKWKAEQEIRLQEKDKAEEINKEELKKVAAKELEDWYKRYKEQLEKNKESNRSEEVTVVAEINDIKPGTEWERVAKQCDFSSKNTRNTKDVSRMRGILLQLKQNPPTRD